MVDLFVYKQKINYLCNTNDVYNKTNNKKLLIFLNKITQRKRNIANNPHRKNLTIL